MPNPHNESPDSHEPTQRGYSLWSVPALLWRILTQQLRNQSLLEMIMPSVAELIDAATTRLEEKSNAEKQEVLTAVNGLKTEVENLTNALGQVSPEAQAALDRLNNKIDTVSDIFTPEAPTGGEGTTTGEGSEAP